MGDTGISGIGKAIRHVVEASNNATESKPDSPPAPVDPKPPSDKPSGPSGTAEAKKGISAMGEAVRDAVKAKPETEPAAPQTKTNGPDKPPKPLESESETETTAETEPSSEPDTVQINGPGSASATPPEGTTHVQLHVNVDETSPDGLNFFAVQVNFDNETWGHGGVQRTDGDRKVNWGGLPVRNDGNSDYTEPSDEQKQRELDRIQNGENRVEDIDWEEDTEYIYEVERGDLVTVPAGEAAVIDNESSVDVDHEREMYEWNFTIRPADGGDPVYEGTMLNSAESIEWISFWNETGYGADNEATSATWGELETATEGQPLEQLPLDGHTGGAQAADSADLASDPPPPEPEPEDQNLLEKAWEWAFG